MTISPRLLLAVSAGGAAGAVTRYGLTEAAVLRYACGVWVPDGDGFPWTTFAINLTGAGLLACLALLPAVRRSQTWAVALGPGVLGGYTTFSATSEQCRALIASGQDLLAGTYVLATLVACLAVVALARRLAPPIPVEESA